MTRTRPGLAHPTHVSETMSNQYPTFPPARSRQPPPGLVDFRAPAAGVLNARKPARIRRHRLLRHHCLRLRDARQVRALRVLAARVGGRKVRHRSRRCDRMHGPLYLSAQAWAPSAGRGGYHLRYALHRRLNRGGRCWHRDRCRVRRLRDRRRPGLRGSAPPRSKSRHANSPRRSTTSRRTITARSSTTTTITSP